MRLAALVLIGLACAVGQPLQVARAQERVAVTIDKITKGDQIQGKVTGLTESGRKANKVVVYVKTDQWYIHPYKDGGDGKSWAGIVADGSWRIETVWRGFPASEVAALVVSSDSRPPSPVPDVGSIPHRAIFRQSLEEGKGKADHGKL